jgi:homoserine kinase
MTPVDGVAVAGSTANLGAGFDTLGLALRLYLRVRIVDVRDDGRGVLTVVRSTPPVDGPNAVARAYASLVARTGRPAPSVSVEVESEIPLAAGLGSSAAATVAGLRVFERVTSPVPAEVLLGVATSLEGHADNAAPSIFGGLTSVLQREGADPVALSWSWPQDLRVIVATPEGGLPTSHARGVLPATLTRTDAVHNLQRVLALVHALRSGDFAYLSEAVSDRWHQDARAALVPHLGPVLALDDPDVLAAFLSGAGPSVAVLARRELPRVARLLRTTCERAGVPVTVRTLSVHQASDVAPEVVASVPGRSV